MRRSPRSAALAALTTVLLGTALGTACTDESGSAKAFCAQVKEVPALESVLARFSEVDADLLADRIDKARAEYDALAEAAPDAIDEETDQVVSLVNDILDAVEQHPTDPAKASAQLRKAVAEHQGIDDDRAKVAAYAQQRCDVQLDATLTEGAATSTSTSTSVVDPGGSSSTTVPATTTTG